MIWTKTVVLVCLTVTSVLIVRNSARRYNYNSRISRPRYRNPEINPPPCFSDPAIFTLNGSGITSSECRDRCLKHHPGITQSHCTSFDYDWWASSCNFYDIEPTMEVYSKTCVHFKVDVNNADEADEDNKKDCQANVGSSTGTEKNYELVTELLDLDEARQRCKQVQGQNSEILTIETQEKFDSVKAYLYSLDQSVIDLCYNYDAVISFWVDAKRRIPFDCSSEYVWNTTSTSCRRIPVDDTMYNVGEPNCYEGPVNCLELVKPPRRDGYWLNDIRCSDRLCAICQTSV